MASNQTEYYGLSQWELTDDVRMEDFNSDNAKIDRALAQSYGSNNKPYVTGSYIGNGVETRVIQLGFTPTAVLVMQNGSLSYNSTNVFGGLAVSGLCSGLGLTTEWVTGTSALGIVEGGFQVSYTTEHIRTNTLDKNYGYIAFR